MKKQVLFIALGVGTADHGARLGHDGPEIRANDPLE